MDGVLLSERSEAVERVQVHRLQAEETTSSRLNQQGCVVLAARLQLFDDALQQFSLLQPQREEPSERGPPLSSWRLKGVLGHRLP